MLHFGKKKFTSKSFAKASQNFNELIIFADRLGIEVSVI